MAMCTKHAGHPLTVALAKRRRRLVSRALRWRFDAVSSSSKRTIKLENSAFHAARVRLPEKDEASQPGDAEVKQAFIGRTTNACLSSFVFAGVFFQNREGCVGKSAWPWRSGARQSRAHPLDQRKMPSRSTSPERAAAGVILAFAREPVTWSCGARSLAMA